MLFLRDGNGDLSRHTQDQVTTRKAYFYTDSESFKLFQFEDGFTSYASSWNRLRQPGKPRELQQFPVQANLIFQEGEKERLSLPLYLTGYMTDIVT